MSHTQPNPAQKYLQLKTKNLIFFQNNYPGIFQFISSYQMTASKLDILPESNEIDILKNGTHLYNGQSQQYAKHEVATFLASYDYGSKIQSIAPLEKDAYKNQRFFAKAISDIQNNYYQRSKAFDGYQLNDFFPLVVFMGIGLGKQIDILTKIRDISHVVALETDMDRFSASLYSVDWEQIVQPYLEDPARSFQFVLIPEPQNEEAIYSTLWNALIKFCPIFPITTLFYNHLGSHVFDRISDKINTDLYVHLFSFGNVDDELNQLNNALHNFKNKIPTLNAENIKNLNVPVCIIGSGPSLDSRIDDLKALADKAIIISSGTALRALWQHGIKPDFQVELESDYNSYVTQAMMEDKAFMKSIKLIGAAQLNPLMFTLFDESRLFFKNDGALGDWFGNNNCIINNATPTCTNASLALALKFQNSPIFLFGLDYGFPDKQSHHASGSVYYKDELKEHYSVNTDDMIEVPSASGGSILTTIFLHTAKRRIENMLTLSNNIKIFNCSDGAFIDKTEWVSPGNIDKLLINKNKISCKDDFINALFKQTDQPISADQVSSRTSKLLTEFESIIKTIQSTLDKTKCESIRDFSNLCSSIFPLLTQLETEDESMFYFIRGSIWHFLLAGYTHAYSLPAEEIKSYLEFWTLRFSETLAMLGRRFEAIATNTVSKDKDPMVNHRLCEAVMVELIWEYQNYSIIDRTVVLDSA